jgi:hypothetical protein
VIADELKTQSSRTIKTLDPVLTGQGPIIKELKMEPLRRKLNNNTTISNNTRRMGDELRRIGL